MLKKLTVVIVNLVFGNLILWLFTHGYGEFRFDLRLFGGFSLASICSLFLAFSQLRAGSSWARVLGLSLGVSLLVPMVGFTVALIDPSSISGLINGVIVGFTAGSMVSVFSLPMVILNVVLFRWVAPASRVLPGLLRG